MIFCRPEFKLKSWSIQPLWSIFYSFKGGINSTMYLHQVVSGRFWDNGDKAVGNAWFIKMFQQKDSNANMYLQIGFFSFTHLFMKLSLECFFVFGARINNDEYDTTSSLINLVISWGYVHMSVQNDQP